MFQQKLMALVLLALAGAIPAQCPDQVVQRIEATAQYGHDLGCGGISGLIAGIEVSTKTECPAFILITPAHDTTAHKPGSNTFTRPAGLVDMTLITFHCRKSYLLFIPLGSYCAHLQTTIPGQVVTYAQFACDDVAGSADA